MLKTALCFADDNSNNSNLPKASHFAINSNQNTIIGQQAYRRAMALCHQLAQDDPSTILKAIFSLPSADQLSLGYLRNKALRMIEISRRNRETR